MIMAVFGLLLVSEAYISSGGCDIEEAPPAAGGWSVVIDEIFLTILDNMLAHGSAVVIMALATSSSRLLIISLLVASNHFKGRNLVQKRIRLCTSNT